MKIPLQTIHNGEPNEFADECRRCGGEIKFVREGTIGNLKSDITECDCIILEHENGLELMGNELKFGNNKILRNKLI